MNIKDIADRLRRIASELEAVSEVKQIEQVNIMVDVADGILFNGKALITEPLMSVEANVPARCIELHLR